MLYVTGRKLEKLLLWECVCLRLSQDSPGRVQRRVRTPGYSCIRNDFVYSAVSQNNEIVPRFQSSKHKQYNRSKYCCLASILTCYFFPALAFFKKKKTFTGKSRGFSRFCRLLYILTALRHTIDGAVVLLLVSRSCFLFK